MNAFNVFHSAEAEVGFGVNKPLFFCAVLKHAHTHTHTYTLLSAINWSAFLLSSLPPSLPPPSLSPTLLP